MGAAAWAVIEVDNAGDHEQPLLLSALAENFLGGRERVFAR